MSPVCLYSSGEEATWMCEEEQKRTPSDVEESRRPEALTLQPPSKKISTQVAAYYFPGLWVPVHTDSDLPARRRLPKRS